MPIYAFRCPQCDLEFEVSRPMREAGNPAACPTDGTTASRIFSATATIGSRGAADAPPAPPPAPAGGHSHGHSHGPGGHMH